jgi:pantoate--beta-alanine ligase
MQIIRTISDLRTELNKYRKNSETIGFAPTMGALHAGHMSLIDIAKKNADKVVVSVFVNPAQFAAHEDFDKYPRPESADLAKLEGQNVDVAYLPTREELYKPGFDIKISVGDIGQELEGLTRPHFFDGVALVLTKLFMQVEPDVAVFGEKDFQQLHVIRKLVDSLDIPVKIIGAPIMREADGLAMSSRNIYLSEAQRKIAPALYQTLQEIRDKIKQGDDVEAALEWGRAIIVGRGFDKVDYLELRDSESLKRVTDIKKSARLLATAYLGTVRLLDNIEIS